MNSRHLISSVLITSAVFGWAAMGSASQVQFRPSLSYQSASDSHGKVGYESFIEHCPSKIYRKFTYRFHQTITMSGVPGGGNGHLKDESIGYYEKDTEDFHAISTRDCQSLCCSGSYYVEHENDVLIVNNATGDPDNCGIDFVGVLHPLFGETYSEYAEDPCVSYSSNPPPLSDTQNYLYSACMTMTDCDGASGQYCADSFYTLEDEYLTEDLIAKLKSKLVYPGSWTSADAASSVLSATLDIAANETSAQGSQFKYRISFLTKAGCNYTVKWTQRIDYDNTDCQETRSTNSAPKEITQGIAGTGGVVVLEDEIKMPGDGTTISMYDFWVSTGDGCQPPDVDTYPGDLTSPSRKDDDCDGEDDDGDGQFDEDCVAPPPGPEPPDDDDCDSCQECDEGLGNERLGFQGQAVQVEFSLGTLERGQRAGRLAFGSPFPTYFLSTPDLLRVTKADPQIEVIRDGTSGFIRQVKVPQGLADVVIVDAFKYQIKFFGASNVLGKVGDFYPTTNSPVVTWTLQNPNASVAGDRLYVIEARGGPALTNDYVWEDGNPGWKLTRPNNTRVDRVKTSWDGSGTVKTETFERLNPATGQAIYVTESKFEYFDWGTALIEQSTTVGADSRVTTYEYWTGPTDNGYGKLKTVIRWDGPWEHHVYDAQGREIKRLSGFLNQAFTTNTNLCRVVYKDYATLPGGSGDSSTVKPFTPRTEVETLLGKEIRRTYRVEKAYESQLRQCQTAGAAWDAADNLVTVTKYVTSGDFENEPEIIQYPDGTLTRHEYASTTTNFTLTVYHGKTNGPGDHITAGQKTVTVSNKAGKTVSNVTYDFPTLIVTSQATYGNFDEQVRHRLVTYLDGTTTSLTYDCCGLQSETDREGVTTSYTYDELKRRKTVSRLGITTTFTYGYTSQGSYSMAVRQGTDTSQINLGGEGFNAWGQLEKSTNALGYVFTNQYGIDGSSQSIVTNWFPDGSSRIQIFARDGTLIKVTGTGVHPYRIEYGVEQDGSPWRAYTKEIKLDAGFSDTSEWTKTYSDMLGRSYKTVHPDGASSQSFHDNQGRLWKQVDPDGNITLSTNINYTEQYTVVDLDKDSTVDWSGTDRITKTVTDVVTNSAMLANVRRTRTYVYPTDSSSSTLLLSTVEASTDGLKTWTTAGGVTNKTQVHFAGSGIHRITNTAPDGSFVVSAYQNGRLTSVTRKNPAGTQLGATTYAYDAHGRQSTVTDARNGATTQTFSAADQVLSVTSPLPGTGQSSQTTSNLYDTMGRVWKTVLPDGTAVTNEYYLTGELKRQYGSRTYPVGYGYDAQGRMTKMTNWAGFGAGSGTRVTTWVYNSQRGWLDKKVYPDETDNTTDYEYKASGRLWKRHWERGVSTTYSYNNAGDLSGIDYSDSTPDVTYTYDRRGRQSVVVQGSMTTTRTYDDLNQLTGETYSGGVLNGLVVTNTYDALTRRGEISAKNGGTPLQTTSFGYDSASRMTNVTDGTYSAGYAYLANSPLIQQITFKQSSTVRMTTTRQYDYLNRLQGMSSVPGASGTVPIAFGYQYNGANQRNRMTLADGSYWVYEYDALGQVISGKRYWADGTRVPGQQYEYGFDDIGNRTGTKAGGNAMGTGLRSATYTANTKNQYSSRTVPNAVDVTGLAKDTATVLVNDSPADYRKGEYWQELLGINNSSAAQYVAVTNKALLAGSTDTVTGNVFLPQTPENYTYDTDGNTTEDGRWTYAWDGENRLLSLTSLSSNPSGSRRKLEFVYDHQGRRIQKLVSVWNGSAYVAQSTNRFLYDGWNLIAELNGYNGVVRTYLWGLDLSGTEQGAGGVGGLVAVKPSGGNVLFAGYDGNGNVAGLVDGTTGTVTARYEYGPFGEVIRVSGTAVGSNPFRFSTKYEDAESDLLYYGYRHYTRSSGRWINRDPMGEGGFQVMRGARPYVYGDGPGVYIFVRNNPQGRIDPTGLASMPYHTCCCDGKKVENKPIASGLLKCTGDAIEHEVDHGWLEMNGWSADFVAGESTWYGVGDVRSSTPYAKDPNKKCEDVLIYPCETDVDKFLKAVKKAVIESDKNPPIYNWAVFNCFVWNNYIISKALSESKGCTAK